MTPFDDAHFPTPDQTKNPNLSHSPPLTDTMQVVMRIGILMLRSGTVSFRVEQAMQRATIALGADHLDSYVTLSGITASIHKNNEHYTQIARIQSIGVDMNRLSNVERLSQTISPSTSPVELATTLDQIEQLPPVYPLRFRVIAVALACGAFALLNGGGLIEFGAAAFGAGIGQMVQIYLKGIQLHSIAITILCATTATLMCHVALSGLAAIGILSQSIQPAFLSAVIFLVPGMALVTASLDLIRFDILSGIVRASYALMQMFGVAIGILLATPLIDRSIF
ncbi:threonine/serine exporter family protein [Egbenema bharatensis]|uniref:threonine/serine exporter family protein n=1 Tax=Egbenema bharatensis TaxID=3463334 RepID=UPI003A88F448